jgi:hypothetical protein
MGDQLSDVEVVFSSKPAQKQFTTFVCQDTSIIKQWLTSHNGGRRLKRSPKTRRRLRQISPSSRSGCAKPKIIGARWLSVGIVRKETKEEKQAQHFGQCQM